MSQKDVRVGVVGAGSFGTTLAILAADAGCDVTLWGHSRDVVESIQKKRENQVYLPGAPIPENIRATSSLQEATQGKQIILAVTPSHVIREIFGQAREFIASDALVVCGSKGVEAQTLATVDQMLLETLPQLRKEQVLVLSGPSFAKEVAKQIPTAVSLAGPNEEIARQVQDVLMKPYFRIYTTPDVKGVALGGSIKNVIAIAVGIADGMGLGHNTRAAVITRGLRELTRLAVARGANPMTLAGLSGMGDLVLTCTGDLSRNRQLGLRLGKGEKLEDIQAGTRMVAEGVRTARSVHQLAQKEGLDAPISAEVYRVLYEQKPVTDGLYDLMHRPPRSEHEFET